MAGGASAPVVAGDGETVELERVGEIDQVLADGGLLGHARRGGVAEARRAVAAQIGNEHAESGLGQRRRDVVIRVDIVGKAVQQDDGEAGRRALA